VHQPHLFPLCCGMLQKNSKPFHNHLASH
jgi:hypothetical protein